MIKLIIQFYENCYNEHQISFASSRNYLKLYACNKRAHLIIVILTSFAIFMFIGSFQSQVVKSFAPTPGPSQDSPSQSPPPVQDALPPTTQLDSPTEKTSLDLTYQNSSLGFKMNYPNSWITQEFDYDPSDPITNIVTFTSPFENTEDKFTENLVVSFQEISDPSMTAEKYVEQAISFYKEYYDEDPKFIDKNTTMVNISGNNYPAYTLIYTEDIYNDKDNPVITAERGYIIGDKAYTFQYARNNQSTFASYLPIVDDMINSFELIRSTEN